MIDRDFRQIPHLVLPWLLWFVVIKVSGVVTKLVDVRRDEFRQAVVFLQVDNEVGLRLPTDFSEGVHIFLAVDGDADHIRPCGVQIVDLRDGPVNILCVCRRHALHGDRCTATNRHTANLHRPRRIPSQLHKTILAQA